MISALLSSSHAAPPDAPGRFGLVFIYLQPMIMRTCADNGYEKDAVSAAVATLMVASPISGSIVGPIAATAFYDLLKGDEVTGDDVGWPNMVWLWPFLLVQVALTIPAYWRYRWWGPEAFDQFVDDKASAPAAAPAASEA